MRKYLVAALLGSAMVAAPAQALVIATGSGTIDTSDFRQLGRLNRDGTAST